MSGTVEANPPVRRLDDWDPARLRDLAGAHGTPLYVLDLERVWANYRRIAAAFPDALVHYAAKANTARAVLQTLREAGAHVECVSAGEVRRALDAGFAPEAVLYTAVNPPDEDLDDAVGIRGLTITAGAADTVDRLAERGFDGRLCLRVNPGVGAGHHEHVTTGDNPKFGIPSERVGEIATDAAERFELVGLHAHAGSGISGEDLSAHRELVSRIGDLAREVGDLAFVDVGGGFGVPYRPDESPLDLDAVAEATRTALGDVDARLAIEPGRYLVADAGVLLTRVNTVKETPDTTVVGVDAGMNTLLRPAMYGAYHEIGSLAPDAPERPTRTVDVTGPICESADVLGEERELPAPARDDLLAVGNAGAYGFEMASRYNSRPLPGVAAVEGDREAVLRAPESLADVASGERGVDWR